MSLIFIDIENNAVENESDSCCLHVKAEPFTKIMDASLQGGVQGNILPEETTFKNMDLLLCSYADYLIHEVKYLRGNNWEINFLRVNLVIFNVFYRQH